MSRTQARVVLALLAAGAVAAACLVHIKTNRPPDEHDHQRMRAPDRQMIVFAAVGIAILVA